MYDDLDITEIVLEEADEEEYASSEEEQDYKALETPCLIVRGVMLEQEVQYLQSLKTEPETEIALYIDFKGKKERIGTTDLTAENLLKLYHLQYDLELVIDDNTSRAVEGSSALLNFLRL